MRDNEQEEQQQHAGEEEEEGEGVVIGDVIGRAEGRLAGKCDGEGEDEKSEMKSDGGKWRTGECGDKEEPLTLDLTVTSPGEQPSPNPGGIFYTIQIFMKNILY